MSAPLITGGCYCGALRYEATALPVEVTHCHCRDCRRSSGAPLVTWATFARARFRFTHGQLREFIRDGRRRGFYARCGTSLTFLLSGEADQIDVTMSSFDRPEAVWPDAAFPGLGLGRFVSFAFES
jgi:hypothetical protein